MNVKIQGGGNGVYANKGSCFGTVKYCEHENVDQLKNGETVENYFNQDKDNIRGSEVIREIDGNKAKLKNKDAKFFVLTISPSQNELSAMGESRAEISKSLKEYTRSIMDEYARNFNKGLSGKDVKYYAKVHHTRGEKGGLQSHVHVIVSRKDMANKIQLSPNTNHRNTQKGVVKGGFNKDNFYNRIEGVFDCKFNYNRSYKEAYKYCNAMKQGHFMEAGKVMSEFMKENFVKIPAMGKAQGLAKILDKGMEMG